MDIISDGPKHIAGYHLLGTARMGDDPETSVVNLWGAAATTSEICLSLTAVSSSPAKCRESNQYDSGTGVVYRRHDEEKPR
ncbi:MAG: hypothetical protein Ct9H300mP13_8630 [Gammaproteobacteria bacterium]|nr:MAG: hypothetical protein Ct9H300mP13_8630 [Gammaproteobacteria bacterium]